jgi:hypothetical protein
MMSALSFYTVTGIIYSVLQASSGKLQEKAKRHSSHVFQPVPNTISDALLLLVACSSPLVAFK